MSKSKAIEEGWLERPDGAHLFYEARGAGDALILCDGLGCEGFAWKYLTPLLSRKHRVIHWNYRGHGKSGMPRDPSRVGIDECLQDLAALMDRLNIKDAVLFGHSMGVQIALEFHRAFPDRVKGLVLICGSFEKPLDTFHDGPLVGRLFPHFHRAVERFPRLAARLGRRILGSELMLQYALLVETNAKLMRREDLLPYFKHLAQMDPLIFLRTLKSLDAHSARDHLPHVSVPTLVAGGEKDTFTPAWLSRRMAHAIPHSELLIVPGGSHTAPLEQPQLIGDAIERFLTERLSLTADLPNPRG